MGKIVQVCKSKLSHSFYVIGSGEAPSWFRDDERISKDVDEDGTIYYIIKSNLMDMIAITGNYIVLDAFTNELHVFSEDVFNTLYDIINYKCKGE